MEEGEVRVAVWGGNSWFSVGRSLLTWTGLVLEIVKEGVKLETAH